MCFHFRVSQFFYFVFFSFLISILFPYISHIQCLILDLYVMYFTWRAGRGIVYEKCYKSHLMESDE